MMKTLIKGQVALLVSMLAAIAITLTACGGGSSSSAGGSGSRNAATVSGTVTNSSLASLDIRNSSGLLVVVSDIFVPVARADAPITVKVMCPRDPVNIEAATQTNESGQFSLSIPSLPEDFADNCDTRFNGQPGDPIPVEAGMTTQVQVVLNGADARVVSANVTGSSGSGALVAGDANGSDDDSVASADDISSDDGVSDDGASDDESVDGESDDDSANSQS